MSQPRHKAHIAGEQRIIEPMFEPIFLPRLDRSSLAQSGNGRVDLRKRHDEENEKGDPEDHERQLHKAPPDQVEHF